MSIKVKDISNYLEQVAPLKYQESYDNCGLLVGDHDTEVTGIVISLDMTEAVIQEAIANNMNMVVAHHPLIFKGLKSVNNKHWVERCVRLAIKNDISLYAIHTNLDNVHYGVNKKICDQLELNNVRILAPKSGLLSKFTTYTPIEDREVILEALYNAGAGEIGNYDHCSFSNEGMGTFRPNEKSNPTLGNKNEDTSVNEMCIEVILPNHLVGKAVQSLKEAHRYEEVAYYVQPLVNSNQGVGSGMIGELSAPVSPDIFLHSIQSKMKANGIRHTSLCKKEILTVAVCGGAGSFLLGKAIAAKADIFISSDFKYHDYFEADNRIIIADIGHYETEQYTKELLYDILSEKFANIALRLTEVVTNPINYL